MENFADVQYILTSFLMLFAGALVMWMAAGFAMLEAGLTRSKNSVVILLKNMLLYAVSSIMFYLIGYNLMYGGGGSFMGDFNFVLNGISYGDHSLMADFFFQVVFVATAASVISGVVAERIKIWGFLIFVAVLTAVIYPIQGHWSWGGSSLGGLMEGFSDFAGSTVVHSVGGWAALAGVLLLGARQGKYNSRGQVNPILGSSLPLATLGTFILWLGWFGFNGGSVLAMGTKENVDSIAAVFAATNMAASFGAVTAAILTQILYKKVDLTMVLNGALAGLVAVTAAPNMGMLAASVDGFVAGILVVFSIIFFDKLQIDDPVGALSVHLVNGIWGTLAVSIWNPEVTFFMQLKGVLIVGLFTFSASFILWYLIKISIGIRVDAKHELDGVDVHETGLEAYPEFSKKG
jgi:ammonium transporter, Amt family